MPSFEDDGRPVKSLLSTSTNIQLLCHGTVGTAVRILITSHREVVLVILLILILCVFRDAESTRKCSGVHETSIANMLETRMNTG